MRTSGCSPLHRSRRSHRTDGGMRGMTLIELLVGVGVGLVAAVLMLRVFVDASASGQNVQRASAQIENGRYALELLRDDLQLAGYYGEASVLGANASTADPCTVAATDFAASPTAFPVPVQGYGASDVLTCLSNRRANTDAIAVRRLATTTTSVADVAVGNAQYYLQASYCESDATSTPMVFDKAPTAFVLRNRACSAANPLRAYVARIYFIAQCNDCSGSGDGVPTLKRIDLLGGTRTETALVEGVETLRLEYGFDTDGDGTVDAYATSVSGSGAASRWDNVVALKLHYIVRSNDKVTGDGLAAAQSFTLGNAGTVSVAKDGYVRRAFSTTVRLVNVAALREQQ